MHIERLAKQHQRDKFDCGVEALNTYIRQFAGQNERLGTSRTYVVVEPGSEIVLGFYSLTVSSFEFQNLPGDVAKSVPRYPIPVAHIARLGVDQSAKGKRLGEMLLVDALRRAAALSEEAGIFAVDVIAKADSKAFYLKYGFQELLDNPSHLYLLMKTILKLGL